VGLLEKRADRKLTTCSPSRDEALQMEIHGAESSSGKDSPGVGQELAATVMNANHALGCNRRSMASRSRKAMVTLFSTCVTASGTEGPVLVSLLQNRH